MRILIVEDDNGKAQKIVECVTSSTGVGVDAIDVCFTVFDAKIRLKAVQYDLMILDIVIPQRGGDAPRSENSAALLVEIRDRNTLIKPRQIIGLTAFEESFKEVGPVFIEQSWAIIRYTRDSSEWKQQIASSVAYLERVAKEKTPATFATDLVIISALEMPEHDAIKRNGWDWKASEPLDDTTFVQKATFTSGGQEFQAVSAYCQKFGMVSAALLASKLIEATKPRVIAMPGICAGVKGKTNYGDVVIADICWDWQVGKHLVKDGEKEFAIQPDQLSLSASLRSKWDILRTDKQFWGKIKDHWRDSPDTELKARIGPAVSGSSVLADPDMVEKIKEQHRGVIAVEMEAYAIFAAAHQAASPRPQVFTCKAVCDFADEKKDDRWQSYAAYTSASALTEFATRYMADLANSQ